jgi:transcriptional regulator with XRE-family HTH domain
MTKLKVKTFGEFLRTLREEAGLPLRTVAIELNIDPSLLGKIERNERLPTKEFIKHVSDFYKINEKELLREFISDQIAYKVLDNEEGVKILKVAEQKIKYLSKSH